uniref:Homeodomain protein HD1 n=1 Tax=Auricularia auricula-judae TaxID=29892 RepID=A0A6M8PZK0_AURAJ|nr:homeodomain protein HD1 [Auricularia auricula-judae]
MSTTALHLQRTAIDSDISSQLSNMLDFCLVARSSGNAEQLKAFAHDWSSLCHSIQELLNCEQCPLSVDTICMAQDTSRTIQSLLDVFGRVEARSNALNTDLRKQVETLLRSSTSPNHTTDETAQSSKPASLPFHFVQPLLQFVLDNICMPYPCAEQKRMLLAQCAAAGWTSVTQRKLEDWMNMARGKMGYTLILKSDAVADDRKVMADFVRRVLFGGTRHGIPAAIVRRIEMMQRWIHDQYESRAAKDQTSPWAQDVVDLVQRLSVPDDVDADAISDDDDEYGLNSDGESDSSSSDTLYSDTDTEDDFDVFPTSVVGAKRKYPGLGISQPLSRIVSRSSSSSSLSSQGTLAEEPAPSHITADWVDDRNEDRPTKRRRSSFDDSSEERTSPTPTVVADSPPAKPKLFEHSYRSQKRKRSSTEDYPTSSPAKRVKHIAAPPCGQVAATDLDALDSICQLDWVTSSATADPCDNVDLSAFLIDTPSLDLEPCPDNLLEAVAACCESPSSLHMHASLTWSKLQVYMLERMLRHGVHIVPSQDSTPVDSTPSIRFDASLFSPEELAYLCSLSLESPGVRQALVGPPDLGLGPDVQEMTGLLRPVDTSVAAPSNCSILPSVEVDFDEWYSSLLSAPLVA